MSHLRAIHASLLAGFLVSLVLALTSSISPVWVTSTGIVVTAGMWGLLELTAKRRSSHRPGPPLVTRALSGVMQPAQTVLREPDLAPGAISELERVRGTLADGTLTPTSTEVANALAIARTAIHGAGVRVSDPLINIPTSLPTDTFIERIDVVIQRLREGS